MNVDEYLFKSKKYSYMSCLLFPYAPLMYIILILHGIYNGKHLGIVPDNYLAQYA